MVSPLYSASAFALLNATKAGGADLAWVDRYDRPFLDERLLDLRFMRRMDDMRRSRVMVFGLQLHIHFLFMRL